MIKYLKYLSYVIRHKWYVAIECFKKGIIWQGITHDMSKFLLSEFIPYARYFYGSYPKLHEMLPCFKQRYTGKYMMDIDKDFDLAWLLHQKRNPHHWQYWILKEDNGNTKTLKMFDRYIKEMICDWVGAGKALGHFSPKEDPLYETRKWYQDNKDKMQLHKETRQEVEKMLGIEKD